jgi:hypothetical protein
MVDRIWAVWQRAHPGPENYLPSSGGPTGHNLNDPMQPWNEATPASLLDTFALGYWYDDIPDGTLLRESTGRIWVVYGGARFAVPNPATIEALFPGVADHQLWNGALDGIPTVPADGTLLREQSSTVVYTTVGRSKSPDTGGRTGTVHVLWDGALSRFPTTKVGL